VWLGGVGGEGGTHGVGVGGWGESTLGSKPVNWKQTTLANAMLKRTSNHARRYHDCQTQVSKVKTGALV